MRKELSGCFGCNSAFEYDVMQLSGGYNYEAQAVQIKIMEIKKYEDTMKVRATRARGKEGRSVGHP
jgi:hypothetical protein